MLGVAAQRIVDSIRKPRNNADEAIAAKPEGTGLAGRSAVSRRSPMGPTIGFASLRASHPGEPPSRPRGTWSEVPYAVTASARRTMRRRGLMGHRDFLLLWSAQGISAVGSRITRTALPMAAILSIGASTIDLGLLAVALTLPGVAIALFAGGWVDRHRRKPLLIAADLLRAAALLAIPAAALTGGLNLPLLYIVAVIVGACSVLFTVADHVFVTDLVSRKRLLEANGKREAVDAIAEISGPAIGGALVALLTAPIAIAADAATFVGSALLIGSIRRRERIAATAKSASLFADLRRGLHVVWRDGAIRALFLATATLTLCFSFMASLYTLYALRDLLLTPAELGVVI